MRQSLAMLILIIASPTQAFGDDALPCPNAHAAWAGAIGPSATVSEMSVDRAGNIYLAGKFWGTSDFDPSPTVVELTSAPGGYDVYATKINPDGSYGWTYAVGAGGSDSASGIVLAGANTVVVAGGFAETVDFDPTEGEDIHTSAIGHNAFVTWLTVGGDHIRTLSFGDPGVAGVTRAASDSHGNVIVVGNCDGATDLDPGPGADVRSCWIDFYIMKLAPDGTRLWAHKIGSSGTRDHVSGVDVDPDGNIYIAGDFEGTVDFDPSAGRDEHTSRSPYDDIFITKFAADGTYAWTRTYNALFPSPGGDIAVDDSGACVVTGGFRGTVDFDPTVEATDWRIAPNDVSFLFATKLNTDGSYAWTYTIGNYGPVATGRAVATDGLDNVYLLGRFYETMDFDPGPGVDEKTSLGDDDLFVTKLTADGSYQYTRTLGNSGNDGPQGIVVDPASGVVVVGWTYTREDLDLDPGCEVLDGSAHGVNERINAIVKLDCPDLATDLDGDGDTDLLDFAAMQNCFTDIAPTTCDPGCPRLDLDPDDDIDLTDYNYFQTELTGP